MATASMDTYTQIGKAEDVSEIVSMISPTNTPFLTLIGSEKCDNILYQWQEDALDAPATNAQVEGADAPAANMNPTTMRSNTTQIFAKTVVVTGSAEEMKLHGAKSEYARQMAKKGKEIKRDLEYALVGTAQTSVTGSSSVARKFAGAQAQHDSSVKLANGGTPRALTETLVVSALQLAYTNGSDVSVALIKPADSQIIANFAGNSSSRPREYSPGDKKVVNVVEVYESAFGTVKFVLDRWLRTSDALFVDPDMWKLRPYRNWKTFDLAKTGDATKTEMLGEFGLSHMNFFDGAYLTDLS